MEYIDLNRVRIIFKPLYSGRNNESVVCHKSIYILSNGQGNLGDVNISALLTSFQTGYDKRVRPNYGGKRYVLRLLNIKRYVVCTVIFVT